MRFAAAGFGFLYIGKVEALSKRVVHCCVIDGIFLVLGGNCIQRLRERHVRIQRVVFGGYICFAITEEERNVNACSS